MKTLTRHQCQSPLGDMVFLCDADALCYLDFDGNPDRLHELMRRRFGEFDIREDRDRLGVGEKLQRYFAKDWRAFDGLRLQTGGSEFQQLVWKALRRIPRGDAISYAKLAHELKRPRAVRAAANANAKNPIAIVIPCHRVIGKNGDLRGYAGGAWRKRRLLAHEGALPTETLGE